MDTRFKFATRFCAGVGIVLAYGAHALGLLEGLWTLVWGVSVMALSAVLYLRDLSRQTSA